MFLIVSRREVVIRAWEAAWRRCGETDIIRIGENANPAVPACDKDETRLVGIDLAILSTDRGELLRQWKVAYPMCPIILGGDEFSAERELAALGVGMSACCDQRLSEEPLSRVMKVLLGGGVWISSATLPLLMNRLATAARAGNTPKVNLASLSLHMGLLTERQREVAALLAQGESNKTIGSKLKIADRTVKAHLTAIFEKFNVSDRLQLALLLNRGRQIDASPAIGSSEPTESLVR